MGSERTYTCKQGDCIASIAARFGLPEKILWDHPANAELKRLRSDPNVLRPGDRVAVPEPNQHQVSAQTGGAHAFTFSAPATRLRVRLTAGGEPRKSKPYELAVDGDKGRAGQTDGDGWVDEQVPATAREARIRFEVPGLGSQVLVLKLGHLDPIGEVAGVQQRLRNLHYHCTVTGELDEPTQGALALFQEAQGLEVTGKIDAGLRDALRKAHGS